MLIARRENALARNEPVPLLDEEIPKELYALIGIGDEVEDSHEGMSKQAQMKEKNKIMSIKADIHDVQEVCL